MNIAFFTDTYFPQLNGVTISVASFAKQLRKKGHTVYIFAPKIKNYTDAEKDVYRLSSIKILSAEPDVRVPIGISYRVFLKLIRMDFDIVHAHGNGPFSFLGYEVATFLGIPFVMTFHNLHTEYTHYLFNGRVVRPGAVKRALRFIANHCDGIIVPSEKMEQKLIEFGCKKDITRIPNFVEFSQYQGVRKGFLHTKLHLPQNIPLLLSVGRLGKEKNFAFLIEMFSKVAKENNAHLVIVGEGKERKNLENQAREKGIFDRVHLIGPIPMGTMPRVYKDATIFVFASTTETQGLCVLEAAVAGVPMVVGDDLAFAEIAIHNKNAYVVPLRKGIFAQKVASLLADKKTQEKFHEYRTHIPHQYDPEALSDRMVSLYTTLHTKRKLQARLYRHMNHVALRAVRGIRHTRKITSHAFAKLISP